MKKLIITIQITILVLSAAVIASQTNEQTGLTAELLSRIELRNIGPDITPGRISDIAIDPYNRSTWYVSVASGGLLKTTNCGITWRPIFTEYGSYSTGCISIDPKNSNILWLGTGENQSLRSVSFGDGIYKSTDGGAIWKNMGLVNSEHIAKILIDPRNSDIVYVACQGPLWRRRRSRFIQNH